MELDLGGILYERLSTDNYGGWVKFFGREQLRGLCERIGREIEPLYLEEMGEIEQELDELNEEREQMINALDKLGLDWDDKEKKLVLTDEFKDSIKRLIV